MSAFRILLLLAVMIRVAPDPSAHGALTIGFFSLGTSNAIDVNVGDSFDLPVYVLQSTPDTVLSEFGLRTMGVKANYLGNRVEVLGIDINPAFNVAPYTDYDNGGGVLEFNSGAIPQVKGATILLATVSMRVKAAGETDIVFSHTFSGFDEFLAADGLGTVLDPVIFGTNLTGQFTATVTGLTAIPEPSGGWTVMLAAMSCLACVRRRTKAGRIPQNA